MLKSLGASIGGIGGIPESEKGAPNGVATLDGNGQIPADQIADPNRLFAVYKPFITNRSSTIVLADDPHLVIPGVVPGTYIIEAFLGADAGNNTPGISVGFRVSEDTPSICYVLGLAGQQATTLNITQVHIPSDTPVGLGYALTTANDTAIHFSGLITVDVTSTVALQWAQSVSDAQSTNVFRGSWMSLRRLGA